MGDFGLAAQLEHSASKRNTVCGTSWYMAPEVYEGKTILKSDVWSLGISLLEMAEGKHPYSGCTPFQVVKKVAMEPPPALTSSHFSTDFADFIRQCLHKDPEERSSVRVLLQVRRKRGE